MVAAPASKAGRDHWAIEINRPYQQIDFRKTKTPCRTRPAGRFEL